MPELTPMETGRRRAEAVERFEQAVMDHAEAGGAMSPSYELRPAKEELDAARAALLARLEAAEAVCAIVNQGLGTEACEGSTEFLALAEVALQDWLALARPAALAAAMYDDRPAGGEVKS